MSDYLNSFRLRNQEKLDLNQMDSKHLELSSLFEFSQTLNSSLDLKTILDNLLFMPMGRMMISKGMILLAASETECSIATVKGMDNALVNTTFSFKNKPQEVLILNTEEDYKNLPDIRGWAALNYTFRASPPPRPTGNTPSKLPARC